MGFTRARQPEQIEARKAQLLASARANSWRSDLNALTLSALARTAGMSKSNVYRYFESREALSVGHPRGGVGSRGARRS